MPSKLKDLFSPESVLYNKLVLGVYIRIKKGVVVLFDGMFADLIEKRKNMDALFNEEVARIDLVNIFIRGIKYPYMQIELKED